MLPIPSKPGLGLEINRDALAEYSRISVAQLKEQLG